MSDLNESAVREKALEFTQQFLPGRWRTLPLDQIELTKIPGGLSNHLYLCSLPDHMETEIGEPKHVLLRLYGKTLLENPYSAALDAVICALMSEKRLGVKLYGLLPEGRLEEYLPGARCLLKPEMASDHIALECARRIAAIHKLHMPLRKDPLLWRSTEKWLYQLLNEVAFDPADRESNEKLSKLLSYDLEKEYQWLKGFLSTVHSPVVFCHNDLHRANILITEDREQGNQLQLIDYEFAGYNFRAFDIADHFCCRVNFIPGLPPDDFEARMKVFPNREKQLAFIRAYLDELGDATGSDGESTMLEEINAFTLASHFFWIVWYAVQSKVSKIDYGYLDYSLARIKGYYWFKKNRKLFLS